MNTPTDVTEVTLVLPSNGLKNTTLLMKPALLIKPTVTITDLVALLKSCVRTACLTRVAGPKKMLRSTLLLNTVMLKEKLK